MNRKLEWTLLTAILALAALLRMGWPGLTEFKQDEAHIYKMALDLAEFRAWPVRGINYSVGLPSSPITIYLYALPLFLWKSPLAATLFVGALNTLSVAVAYWIARRYWGARSGLWAALLYAAAIWAIVFSRKLWSNNLLPLFIAGYMASGLLAFVEGRTRWLIAHFALWSIAFQLHLSAGVYAPVTLLLMWVYRRRLNWRTLAYGALAAGLLALPYALFLLTRFSDWSRALAAPAGPGVQISLDSVQMAALLIQGTFSHGLVGPGALPEFRAVVPNVDGLLGLGGWLVVLGLGYVAWQWVVGRRSNVPLADAERAAREAGLILALWVVTPILFLMPHATPVYPWYLIILFPAPYLLAGIFVGAVVARVRSRWGPMAVAVLPLLLAAGQAWLWFTTLNFISTYNTPGAFGPPLGKLIQAAEAARHLSTTDILVVSDGADPNADFASAVFEALLTNTPHRFVDGRTTAVFPAGQAAVILWPGDYPSRDLYRQWSGGQWAAVVPLRMGEGEAALAVARQALPVPRPREASALLSNGAELLGSDGDAARWELWWRAGGPLNGDTYQVFAHLLDANVNRTAQSDQATYADWRADDLVISYFALNNTGSVVRTGMYAYPSLAPAVVLDAQGNPAGEWIEFALP
jgi:4-amino-4-deoxy-L-arabinose transferase-like glycosyltransferase